MLHLAMATAGGHVLCTVVAVGEDDDPRSPNGYLLSAKPIADWWLRPALKL